MNTSMANASNDDIGTDSAVWVRTEAGQLEARARAVVKERPLRHLLMAVDGISHEGRLRASLKGLTDGARADFDALRELGLIEPAKPRFVSALPTLVDVLLEPLTYSELSAALTEQIASQLGLTGLRLTLDVERARTLEDLNSVKDRLLTRISLERGTDARRRAEQQFAGKIAPSSFAETVSPTPEVVNAPTHLRPLESSELSAALTRIISHEFGIRGIWLTLALERAESIDDLRRVAKDVIARVERESGPLQSADVAHELEGVEVEGPG